MKLVICPAVDPERLAKITRAAQGMQVANAANERDALERMADADAFFGKLTPALLAAAGRLRWVQAPTASLEHFIFPELIAHSCVVTNMRGLFSDVIAEQVLGYMLCFARNLHLYVRQQLAAHWAPIGGEEERVGFETGPARVSAIDQAHPCLFGASVGIIGLGGIGQAVAARAAAFGMAVRAVDPAPKAEAAVDCWPTERLPDLLAQSDYVVIAAPHTPRTWQLFRRRQFQMMRRTAYLINVGRGAILNLADLVASLEARDIAGAALDVYEIEPLPAEHALWKFPNVILTPHVAGYSPLIAGRHLALLLDNLDRFVRGVELRNVVNKAEWY